MAEKNLETRKTAWCMLRGCKRAWLESLQGCAFDEEDKETDHAHGGSSMPERCVQQCASRPVMRSGAAMSRSLCLIACQFAQVWFSE